MDQPPNPLPPKKFSIFGTNLIIFLAYYLVTVLLLMMLSRDLQGYLMWGLALYIIHAFILFIFAVIRAFQKLPRVSSEYALTAFALLIIGFGVCTATFFEGSVIGFQPF